MNDKQMIQRIEAKETAENNGKVLRAINILHCKYNKLKSVEYGIDIEHRAMVDSVNYLSEAGYIHLRHVDSKEPVSFADTDFCDIEAKLTDKGIRLIAGKLTDDLVEV